MTTLERVFSPRTLIAINVLLILVSQFWAGGDAFHDTGLVHIVAILFIALAVTRLFQDYGLYDPLIKRFVSAALIALLFFAASHIVEFIGIAVLDLPPETAIVSVFSVYIASILFLILGVQFVLRKAHRQSSLYSWALVLVLSFLISSIVYVMVRPGAEFHSASAPGAALALFGIALILIVIFQIIGFAKIRKALPAIGAMQTHLIWASVFIVCSAVPTMLYQLFDEPLEHMGFDHVQTVYVSHYFFYAAASALYLAFGPLGRIGGIYKDLREESSVTPQSP